MKDNPYISDELETLFWPLYEKKLKSEKAKKTYWSDITSFIKIVKKDFLDITAADVDYFYDYHTQKVPIRLATLQKKFRELSAFSDFIVDNISALLGEGTTFENYFFDRLSELHEQVKMSKGHIPTLQEMDKLLQIAATDNVMHYAILSLIYRCAIRPSELLKIKPTDFLKTPDGAYLKIGTGTKKKERIIPLPEDIVSILKEYDTIRNKQAIYYFYKKIYEPINERTLERLIQGYAQEIGMSPITLYGVRDASVALMCASGAPDSKIARDCGLTEIGVDRYKQLLPAYTLEDSAINLMRIRILPYKDKI